MISPNTSTAGLTDAFVRTPGERSAGILLFQSVTISCSLSTQVWDGGNIHELETVREGRLKYRRDEKDGRSQNMNKKEAIMRA